MFDDIKYLLNLLNKELIREGIKVEISMYDGVLIYLVYREKKRIVHEVFESVDLVENMLDIMSIRYGVKRNWLKLYVKDVLNNKQINYNVRLSNLRIYYVIPYYMLTLKVLACGRGNENDYADVYILIEYLGVSDLPGLMAVISDYINVYNIDEEIIEDIVKMCGWSRVIEGSEKEEFFDFDIVD